MILKEQIRNCKLCPLHLNMPTGCKPVPGQGLGRIMFIGESLSKEDSILEEPISGQLGQFFEKVLDSSGLSREKCYITMAVKCFANGKLKAGNIKACRTWLEQEIESVKPKVVFTLGKIATKEFIQLKALDNIKDYIGKEFSLWYRKDFSIKLIPLYSMSYLFQHSSAEVKETVEIIRRYSYDE